MEDKFKTKLLSQNLCPKTFVRKQNLVGQNIGWNIEERITMCIVLYDIYILCDRYFTMCDIRAVVVAEVVAVE